MFDVVALAQKLLRCASVTPADDGAMALLVDTLEALHFKVTVQRVGPKGAQTINLFAHLGEGSPHLCFAGHTDVVPADGKWRFDPFSATIDDGKLYGRGACDMKGAIAAFVAAAAQVTSQRALRGSISLLITGDEEGSAEFGTRAILPLLTEMGRVPDFCLVGEPTNPSYLGEMVKVGRRGSLNAHIEVVGIAGHVAYPHLADNPMTRLVRILHALQERQLDHGSAHFAPSSLQVTQIEGGGRATNVIPDRAEARLNIRFNDLHTGESLASWIREVVACYAPHAVCHIAVSGEAFRTAKGPFLDKLVRVVERVTKHSPRLDTGGGTSDARFIASICPVAEFGLVGATMHKVDECVSISDLHQLKAVYAAFIEAFGL